jgi:8-oxo-dGTP pyrophosphatase MutT (NUDIX family)
VGYSNNTLEFVTTAYVIHRDRVLLVFHRNLARWLPPGGHIDAGETPDQATVREVFEETGLHIRLLSDRGHEIDYTEEGVRILARPLVIQLEDIAPGHQHVDLVFTAITDDPTLRIDDRELESARWFDQHQLRSPIVLSNVRHSAMRALELVRKYYEQNDAIGELSVTVTF